MPGYLRAVIQSSALDAAKRLIYRPVQLWTRWVVAYQVSDQPAVFPKDQRLGNGGIFAAQVCNEHIIRRQPYRVRYPELPDELLDFVMTRAAPVVYVKPQDFNPSRPELVRYSNQLRCLLPARLAPGRPEIHYQDLASIVGKPDRPSIYRRNVEIRQRRLRATRASLGIIARRWEPHPGLLRSSRAPKKHDIPDCGHQPDNRRSGNNPAGRPKLGIR